MNFDKVWSVLINKAHVAIATMVQGSILFMHWRYGKDLSANVQQTVNWFYMFLAGHFGASQVWPDKDDKDGDGIPDAQEAHGPLPNLPTSGTGSGGAKG